MRSVFLFFSIIYYLCKSISLSQLLKLILPALCLYGFLLCSRKQQVASYFLFDQQSQMQTACGMMNLKTVSVRSNLELAGAEVAQFYSLSK